VKENPWENVAPPKTDRLEVKYATDAMIEQFYKWIGERFDDWPFPKLFLSAKSYTGCRLMDLCSLKSAQLIQGRDLAVASVPARPQGRDRGKGMADASASAHVLSPEALLLDRDPFRRLPQGVS
jgi:hypothetical protein